MKENYYLIYNKLFSLFIILIPWQIRYIFFTAKINNQIWEYGHLSLYLSIVVLLLAALFYLFNNHQKLKRFFSFKTWSRQAKALALFSEFRYTTAMLIPSAAIRPATTAPILRAPTIIAPLPCRFINKFTLNNWLL